MADNVDTRVTMSLHPDTVKNVEGYDDEVAPVLAPTMTALSAAYLGVGAVHTAREKAKANPAWTEAAQIIMTQDLADKIFANVAKGFDTTSYNLQRGIAALEQELSQPVTTKAAGSIAAEIRAHTKALPTATLHEFVRHAIDSDDHDPTTAILGAPAYLSGLTPDFQKTYLKLYHERNNPQGTKRLKAMKGALTILDERGGLVFRELEKAVGVPPHKVNALRAAKTAAEKAFVLKDI